MNEQTRQALTTLIDRLEMLEDHEWMIQEWQLKTNKNWHEDERYHAAKHRERALNAARTEAHELFMSIPLK